MNYLFLTIIGIYSTIIFVAVVRWLKITHRRLPGFVEQSGFFSIIIPVRNEAQTITRLLDAIAEQQVQKTSFEVIVVDDHSTDGTLELVQSQSRPYKLTVLSLEKINKYDGVTISGKKHAISEGIKHAAGEIIITTDADCYMGKDWLGSIYNYFAVNNAKMVVGPVAFDGAKGLFEELQSIEFAVLIGVGAVALESGSPNMCNGANLAFRKKVFYEVEGYSGNFHIPSGDDEFLLQKIYSRFPRDVYFNSSKASVVYTEPVSSIWSFIDQRRRWSSKWKLHKSWGVKAVALGVFCFHLFLIISLVAAISGDLHLGVFAGGMVVKAIAELFFLKKLLDHFDKPLAAVNFILLQAIYSIYVLVFGVLSNFGSFEWKGRSYKQ